MSSIWVSLSLAEGSETALDLKLGHEPITDVTKTPNRIAMNTAFSQDLGHECCGSDPSNPSLAEAAYASSRVSVLTAVELFDQW